MARKKRPPELQRVHDKLNSARREIVKAVERAADVDLLPGHLAEMRRQTVEIRRELDAFPDA